MANKRNNIKKRAARIEATTAVLVKIRVFWDVVGQPVSELSKGSNASFCREKQCKIASVAKNFLRTA